MNDEEFGRIAFLLCKTEGIDQDAIGEILWQVFDDNRDDSTGYWKNTVKEKASEGTKCN